MGPTYHISYTKLSHRKQRLGSVRLLSCINAKYRGEALAFVCQRSSHSGTFLLPVSVVQLSNK